MIHHLLRLKMMERKIHKIERLLQAEEVSISMGKSFKHYIQLLTCIWLKYDSFLFNESMRDLFNIRSASNLILLEKHNLLFHGEQPQRKET